jgi:uncharacterized membrane protein YkgB
MAVDGGLSKALGLARLAFRASALWLALVFPSLGLVQKFLGNIGLVGYLLGSVAIVVAGYRKVTDGRGSLFSERQAQLALAVGLLTLGWLFWIVYPFADAGVIGGGSDRDDALRLGVDQLLAGGFPYYGPTYLGNPITPMPGALVLSAPFAVVEPLAWQNLAWLAAYGGVLRWVLGDWRSVAWSAFAIVVLSPVLLHALVTGSDLIANSVAVMVFLAMASYVGSRVPWLGWLSAVLFGLALSWRASFLFLLPLLWSAVLSRHGWAQAASRTVVAVVAFTLVTLPFYLYAPDQFTPLKTLGKLRFSEDLAVASALIPASTALLALAFARRDNAQPRQLLRHAFWLLSLPVIAVVVISSIDVGTLDLRMSDYGLCALFFGVAGFWPRRSTSDDELVRPDGRG